ncbi:helix-turn-helix domain-containing protein [Listeria newyorkensis]|uniref:Helix-turn-helix transcriptional regulator n=1 Tax=Listeria newyorkensis TaxID=1497681 RepID=A0A841Z0X9_9LIST|nr:helix-turn-helix transcriptional regulator [Listeria newyorkensis]MBC1459320.1 helix-turn-helix transcriptional regulator [Listeria newyorkensis]
MDIHERIVLFRKRQEISQKELADMVGVDDSTMSKIENGTRALRHFEIEKIADALNVSIEELFGRAKKTDVDVLLLRFNNGLNDLEKNKILSFVDGVNRK